jgi:AraC family transcriptional regulator, regulatory protein of adaptative response / methylated-DNA-[protein]-cysteine methyltransferase
MSRPILDTITADPRWAQLTARSSGDFVYGVSTTGIYCRPACPARLPKPEHVSFYDSPEAAEAAGFRPCLRCGPRGHTLADQQVALVTHACRLLEEAVEFPDLASLAAEIGLSKHHFQRVFKQVTGLTPKAYTQGLRAGRLRDALAGQVPVTQAIYEAGYQSQSRFYEQSQQLLGMSASQYRAGGERVRIQFALGECDLGAILVARTERGLCAILLGGHPEPLLKDLQKRFPKAELVGGEQDFEQWMAQVVGFVEAPRLGLALPLDIRGTAFQQRVWQALTEIPPGTTASYTDIAERLGSPKAVRAVAGACAANALAVAIPCHRVVRSDGGLSGYRWGVERKRALLTRERHQPPEN